MADEPTRLPVQESKGGAPGPARRDWPSLADLRRDMDNLFEDFTRDVFRVPSFFRAREPEILSKLESRLSLSPSVDIVEADGGWRITAELPGMDPKSVEVTLSGDVLTLRGEKSESKEEDDRGTHVSERRYGSFARSFTLPPGVDRDRIEADMANGVLTLKLPKSAEAKASEKKIDVKVA